MPKLSEICWIITADVCGLRVAVLSRETFVSSCQQPVYRGWSFPSATY